MEKALFGDLLGKGLIWRIGNERKIKFWNDLWIPKPLSNKIQSPILGVREDDTMDKLLIEGGNS